MTAIANNGKTLIIALLVGIIALGAGIAVAHSDSNEIRITAMRHDDGRIEFAVQERDGEGWGERVLPRARFFPASGRAGRWLVSTPIMVGVGDSSAAAVTQVPTPASTPEPSTHSWEPVPEGQYFYRCGPYVHDDHVPVAISAPWGDAASDGKLCLRPGGTVELDLLNDGYEGKIQMEFVVPAYAAMRDYDLIINGESYFGLDPSAPYYTRRIGYETFTLDIEELRAQGEVYDDPVLVTGRNAMELILYGHWPEDEFCAAWYSHQRTTLGRSRSEITSCRGDDRLTDTEYSAFVEEWNEGQLYSYSIPFDLVIEW